MSGKMNNFQKANASIYLRAACAAGLRLRGFVGLETAGNGAYIKATSALSEGQPAKRVYVGFGFGEAPMTVKWEQGGNSRKEYFSLQMSDEGELRFVTVRGGDAAEVPENPVWR